MLQHSAEDEKNFMLNKASQKLELNKDKYIKNDFIIKI